MGKHCNVYCALAVKQKFLCVAQEHRVAAAVWETSVLLCVQEYKNSKEMLPKAAFQFGVKAADGRKAGNKLGKARENKLNTQLNKIQAILEKDGGDYKKAFSAPQELNEGGKVSKKRRI